MAKFKVGASSTVCGAANHNWGPSLAPNYRVCLQCRTVEVLRDGQWVNPTGRGAKHSPDTTAPAPALIEVQDRDLQAKTSRLVEVPAAAKTVSPSHGSTGDEHFKVMIRRNRGQILFRWGQDHGFPQLHVPLPGGRRVHTIVSGVSAWRVIAFEGPLEIVEAALVQSVAYDDGLLGLPEVERAQRLALIEHGRRLEWKRFMFQASVGTDGHFTLVIEGTEKDWKYFAASGDYAHVCEACRLLEQGLQPLQVSGGEQPEMGLDEARVQLLDLGKQLGYPAANWTDQYGMPYKLPAGEDAYRDRAAKSTVRWLWSAIQAIKHAEADRVQRDRLLKLAQVCGWKRLAYQLSSAEGKQVTLSIGPGEEDWRKFAEKGSSVHVVQACEGLEAMAAAQAACPGEDLPELLAAERARRLALIELGRARNWKRLVWRAVNPGVNVSFSMVLDGGVMGWTRYAYTGRYEHICQVCELLERAEPRVEVRTEHWYRGRLVQLGRERGWTEAVCSVKSRGDDVTVTVGPGEEKWCDFALHGDGVQVAQVYEALEKEAEK
jgi:hypothetical protein